MIDIRWLLPKEIEIQVWDCRYKTELLDDKYILHKQVDKDINTDKVLIYIWDKLFDTIYRWININKWDILHLEYSIYVW